MRQPSRNLRAVWDAIPDTGCKGLCIESCGPIGASEEELDLLADRGVVIEDPLGALLAVLDGNEPATCPALVDGRCSVYDVRPTVCRLWGVVDEMPCPHGCVPRGGRLMAGEGQVLLARAMEA